MKKKTQKELEESLNPGVREFYRRLKQFVAVGSVLVEHPGGIATIEKLELGENSKGEAAGFIFSV